MEIFRSIPFLIVAVALFFTAPTGKDSHGRNGTGVLNPLPISVHVHEVASGLNVPWEIVWGPDNWIWFTEQSGTISRLNPNTGEKQLLVKINEVYRYRSLGLLGMALHPDFAQNPYVYVDYTCKKDSAITTKLVRFTYHQNHLADPHTMLEIPAHTGHNGSRIVISPDRKLMFATGDAITITHAQNTGSLNGKVLRMNLDGSVPADNPIKGSFVWSWGHRNIQGLAYGANGILYSSEHGDAVEDELNIVRKGQNYGWPKVEGFCDQPNEQAFCDSMKVTEPMKAWTPTIAPAGIAVYEGKEFPEWKGAVLQTTLKEADLRVLKTNAKGTSFVSEQIPLDATYGRLRAVCVAPDGSIYVSTSNRDWNPGSGFPEPKDDRILRIKRGTQADLLTQNAAREATNDKASNGARLYRQYCASCHKPDGKGSAGIFPTLHGTEQVKDKGQLVKIMLTGLSGKIIVKGEEFDQHMPALGFLPDDSIAEIGTYVRQFFNQDLDPVSARDVSNVRAK
ncbi:PQQ-dependent sugar dehydrogenase [Dyadobacter sp. CY261]|uniref:PQQ-dependent sugar dehydrogenase n=1 Tax=Dyadobacter sp. CY261 TaxID=2907203 RepID=UPI001F3D5EDE|nr:PQQ-dependent sugar dehydrogenase [Dyadobacter sp. CY261]MCF0070153.1 PQQ-dependent sugar dehydrogenase [Dyadobacter sp. CY261]